MKENKGITLIALIITIVIMLILVAVTIDVVIDGKLFDTTKEAVDKTNEKVDEEQEKIDYWTEKLEEINYTIPEKVDIAEIKKRPDIYYGMTVTGYSWPNSSNENVEWKLFHADETNIYLIASDYVTNVPNGKAGTPIDMITDVNSAYCFHMGSIGADYTGGIDLNPSVTKLLEKYLSKYPSTEYGNMKVTAYMLDTNQWGSLYKGNLADYAIGTPTLELFIESYNAVYSTNLEVVVKDDVDTGYYIKDNNGTEGTSLPNKLSASSLYVIPQTPENGGRAYGMWIASPSAQEDVCVYRVYGNGEFSSGLYWRSYDENFGFRPVVCLNSGVTLSYTGGNTLEIATD